MANFIRMDKVKPSAHIESVVAAEQLFNGQFVELGTVDETNGGEAVGIVKTAKGKLPEAIISTVHISQGHPDFDITKAVTKAGKAARAHILEHGDVISFLNTNGVVAVGDDVAVGADGLGIGKAVLSDIIIGKVIRTEYQPNIGDLAVVRIKMGEVK